MKYIDVKPVPFKEVRKRGSKEKWPPKLFLLYKNLKLVPCPYCIQIARFTKSCKLS